VLITSCKEEQLPLGIYLEGMCVIFLVSLYMHMRAWVHTLTHSKTCTNMSLCIHNSVSYNSLGVLGLVMGSVTWLVFVRGCMRLV
jgi:hypothetical protein